MPPTAPSRGGPSTGSRPHEYNAHYSSGKVKDNRVNSRPMIGGKGIITGARRHRKIARDTINGITKGDIRRLARRGGIKRFSGTIHGEIRAAIKDRLTLILRDCVTYAEYRNAKTISIDDVLFALRRIGRPLYGFDSDSWTPPEKKKPTT